jgi:bifunctional non-homologous end joining protein LigD
MSGPIRPMLATAGAPPTGPGWTFEIKWDGMRAIADTSSPRLRFTTREGNNVAEHFPDLAGLIGAVNGRSVVLDGELVALDGMGRPALSLLQKRKGATPRSVLLAGIPVYYYVFDVLSIDGESVARRPYIERRGLLDELRIDSGSGRIRVPPSRSDISGAELLGIAQDFGLEGIVSKRLDAKYQPGVRSRDWIKTRVAEWRPGT